MRNAIHWLFTFSFLLLLGSCGIKWATNKVLTNRSAIEQVGAVYDALTPKDTTERIVFIQGDSIVLERIDTVFSKVPLRENTDSYISIKDTIRITRTIRRTDTIRHTLPPDNRAMARLLDSLGKYTNELNEAKGNINAKEKALKTAENRLYWFAAIVLVLGVVIGLLLKFKIYPRL